MPNFTVVVVPFNDNYSLGDAGVATIFGSTKSYAGAEAPLSWNLINRQLTIDVSTVLSGYTKAVLAIVGAEEGDAGMYARVFIGVTESEIADIPSIPLPLYAIGDGDNTLQITIQGSAPNTWAGWQSALPAGGVVRMTGFNLPRTLTSYTGATPTTINAQGGDYGIEFTIPQNSDSLAIFDETFWLYIR